jgi:glycosyltransferase involved in cell wall biosynthesis
MGQADVSERIRHPETQRRRVLFILPSLRGGGTERVITILLRHLDRGRFEPHLALLEKAGPFLDEVPADVPIHDLNVSRVRYAFPSILEVVWELRPDTVLSSLCELNLAVAFVKPFFPPGTRLLLQEATSLSSYLAEKGEDTGLMRWLYRRLYSRATKIICKADYVLDDLARHFGIPRDKMLRIYNPVDVARITQLAESGANPFPTNGPHLVAAGRLVNVKGFDVLLDALKLVRETIPVQLTILGEGPLESDLKARSTRLGLSDAVRFAGFQANPYAFYKHADLFVLSSRYEGMPSAILEALSLGTPVVATDCPGGVREIIAGSNMGLMVPSSNPRLLAEAIISAIESGKQKPSKTQELEALLEKFGVDRVMAQYEDLL